MNTQNFAKILFISLIALIFAYCAKETQKVTNIPVTSRGGGCTSPLALNVGTFHNQVLAPFVGSNSISSYASLIGGYNSTQKSAYLGRIVDSIIVHYNATGIGGTLYKDSLLKFIANTYVPANPTFYDFVNAGYSTNASNILVHMLNIMTNIAPDLVVDSLNVLYVDASSLSSSDECVLVSNTLDVAKASYTFWLNVPANSNGVVSERGDHKEAAKADAIGFCSGAIHGALDGAIFGGGVPGAFAGALLLGAVDALASSCATYWWR